MRLLRIELTRYGPFEGKTLEFDPMKPLAIVYGPNEAGKSSLLAALGDLLFGLPHEAPHANFRYDYKRLEIGAEIENGAGERLYFRRLKRKIGDLVDADGAALGAGALAPFLGSIDRDAFEQLFGLDAARLRAHGRALLDDGGALGESLLSAGALLGGLTRRRAAIDAEAERVFAPKKAQHRRFYAALDAWRAARRDLGDRSLTRSALREAEAALTAASETRGRAEAALEELEKTRARDRRVAAAADILPELDALRAERDALGPPPDPALVAAAEKALAAAEETARRSEEAAKRAEQARAALDAEPEPGPALGAAAAIEAAAKAAVAAEAERKAKAERQAAMTELGARKARLAARLGLGADALLASAPTDAARRAAAAALKRRHEARLAHDAAAKRLESARAKAAATGESRPTVLEAHDPAAARATRDAAWAELRAELDAGRLPERARLDRQESLTRLADLAADARIDAAGQSASVAAAAAAVAEADKAASAAADALAEATGVLVRRATGLLGDAHDVAQDDLEAAAEAALEAWRAAEPLFDQEAALQKREAAVEEGGAALEDAAAALAAALGEEPPSHPALCVERWSAELKAARTAHERRQARAERLRDETAALEEATRRRKAAARTLADVAGQLGVADAGGVSAEIARAARVREAAAALGHLERRLRDASEGRSEAAIRDEVAATDLDEARARLEAGERYWREAKKANDAAVAAEAEAKAARAALDADQGAAEAARAEENAAAEMTLAAEEWLTLRAAALILTESARRYRERAANPVLAAASRHFETLTLGGFEALVVEPDEAGVERIVAVRSKTSAAPGERVDVEGLSEGARDQLFLALRLAAIERWAADRPTPPFIADDLFASFDDERLAAGLSALAGLGGAARPTMQCVALTHHAHVPRIAAAHLGELAQILHL